jgi:hypothetical protein
VVLAVALAIASTPHFVRATVPPLDSLPWAAVDRLTAPRVPLAVLYVQSRCSHCSRAAVTFDSIAAAIRVPGIVVTSDSASVADAYRAKLSLRSAIALDTARRLMTALEIESVPTLVVFGRDGSRRLTVGFRDRSAYSRLMRSIR